MSSEHSNPTGPPLSESIGNHTLVLISSDTEHSDRDDTWIGLAIPKNPTSVTSSPVPNVIVLSDSPSPSPLRTTSLRMERIPPRNGRLHEDTDQRCWVSTGGCHAQKKLDMDAVLHLPKMRMMAPCPPCTPDTCLGSLQSLYSTGVFELCIGGSYAFELHILQAVNVKSRRYQKSMAGPAAPTPEKLLLWEILVEVVMGTGDLGVTMAF